ncbi:hypothetical protein C7Y69_15230 [Alteromonas sp. KS69]|uniref:SGNH hydrolase domain-containing protein n=1 Tax=Alteromonas sp. KS69 TaxID=2109917 RepID=UPI000F875459|nr:SGNH hydrolase domain-containing protein [Alteromonas sp. KS69]RUP78403.1 hypothetical protein C7Y69_15230 [Alteromonas sp. KS69]
MIAYIVVAGYYFELGENWWAIGIPLSLILGALSFKFIESKTLSDFGIEKAKYLLRPLPFATISAALGLLIFNTNGMTFRLPVGEQLLVKSAIEATDDWNYPEPNLEIDSLEIRFIKGKTDSNILIMGASHIEQIYPYVENLNSPYNIYFLTKSGCFVTPSMKHPKWSCQNLQSYEKLIKTVTFDKVLTSFYNFNSYLPIDQLERSKATLQRIDEYDSFLKLIKSKVSKIYLMLGEPRGDEFSPILSMRKGLPDYITKETAKNEYLEEMAAFNKLSELDSIEIIDPIEKLCEANICKTRNQEIGFFYRDDDHMRTHYAIEKLKYLDHIFNHH